MHKKCSAVIHAHLFIRDHCVALKGFGHVRSLHNEPRYSRSDFQYLKTTQLVKRNDIASLQTCMFRNFCMMLRASANFSDVCKNVLMWKIGVCLRNKNFITWRFCCVRIFSWLFNRLLQHKLENSASGLPQGAHLVFSQVEVKAALSWHLPTAEWESMTEKPHQKSNTETKAQGKVEWKRICTMTLRETGSLEAISLQPNFLSRIYTTQGTEERAIAAVISG